MSSVVVPCSPYNPITITAGTSAIIRVMRRRIHGRSLIFKNPSITIWPASVPVSVEFWPDARTIASGLRVPKAFADHLILDAIYASRGIACAVSDDAIVAAVKEVAAGDGLFLCPEGAATVVALKDLLKKQFIKPSDVVVLFNTAAGNKYPEVVPD